MFKVFVNQLSLAVLSTCRIHLPTYTPLSSLGNIWRLLIKLLSREYPVKESRDQFRDFLPSRTGYPKNRFRSVLRGRHFVSNPISKLKEILRYVKNFRTLRLIDHKTRNGLKIK